jgi:hypothetical protein
MEYSTHKPFFLCLFGKKSNRGLYKSGPEEKTNENKEVYFNGYSVKSEGKDVIGRPKRP